MFEILLGVVAGWYVGSYIFPPMVWLVGYAIWRSAWTAPITYTLPSTPLMRFRWAYEQTVPKRRSSARRS